MITLEELYNKVMSDREIMQEFVKASGTGSLSAFAKSYDCDASQEQIQNFFISKCGDKPSTGDDSLEELSDDDLENVAGGSIGFTNWLCSFFSRIFGSDIEGIIGNYDQRFAQKKVVTTTTSETEPVPFDKKILEGPAFYV